MLCRRLSQLSTRWSPFSPKPSTQSGLPPGKSNSRHVLEDIDRFDKLRSLSLPLGVERLAISTGSSRSHAKAYRHHKMRHQGVPP